MLTFLDTDDGKAEEYSDALVRDFVQHVKVYDCNITIVMQTGQEINM